MYNEKIKSFVKYNYIYDFEFIIFEVITKGSTDDINNL